MVRGYSIIDHAEKIAFDGSKVMNLSELIDFAINPQKKPSPLDVYRDMFTIEVGKDGRGNYMHINVKDGSTYRKPISPRQYAWYNGVKDDEREDVGLTIAATMFSKEILAEYLMRYPIHNYQERIKGMAVVKHRNGNYCLRVALTDGYIPLIELTPEEESTFRSLHADEQTRQDFLMSIAMQHLTRKDADAVKDRIKQNTQSKAGVRIPPSRTQDYSPEISQVFTFNLANALSSLNVSSGSSGHKREHEVGSRSRYDDIDDRQSGTSLYM